MGELYVRLYNLNSFKQQPPGKFYKKVPIKFFAKLTEKHLCRSIFFNKVAKSRSATILKRLGHRCFLVNTEIFRNTFFTATTFAL